MDLTLPLLSQTEPSFHGEKSKEHLPRAIILRDPGRAGLCGALWDRLGGTPNRRQPAFKNGVCKQKLHNKDILNLEEIFKIVPKIPQQTSRTFPTTPPGWLSSGAGFGSSLVSSLRSLSYH